DGCEENADGRMATTSGDLFPADTSPVLVHSRSSPPWLRAFHFGRDCRKRNVLFQVRAFLRSGNLFERRCSGRRVYLERDQQTPKERRYPLSLLMGQVCLI